MRSAGLSKHEKALAGLRLFYLLVVLGYQDSNLD
jgi:hypothetical protein